MSVPPEAAICRCFALPWPCQEPWCKGLVEGSMKVLEATKSRWALIKPGGEVRNLVINIPDVEFFFWLELILLHDFVCILLG